VLLRLITMIGRRNSGRARGSRQTRICPASARVLADEARDLRQHDDAEQRADRRGARERLDARVK